MAQIDLTRGHQHTASARISAAGAVRGWALHLLGLISIIMALGSTWDVKWHYTIGRDTFWIPPHMMLYLAVALAGLLSAGVIIYETWQAWAAGKDRATSGTTRFLGFSGPLGLFISGFGVVTVLMAAPFDNLWHSWYGVDVTIWSPPHMTGVLGVGVITFGGLALATSNQRTRGGRGTMFMMLLFLMGLVGIASFALLPAARLSFWPRIPTIASDPVDPGLLYYPLLASLTIAWTLTATARLFSGRRAWLVVLSVLGLFVLLNIVQTATARAGFALFLPWGDQVMIRPLDRVENAFWDHPILLALPTAALALAFMAGRDRPFERVAPIAGAIFGLALMLEGVMFFLLRNPNDTIALGTLAAGFALAPALGAISGLLGTAAGRWLDVRAA